MVNFNEIAYDSPCARVYRQERSRVVGFLSDVADAAIGLTRASKNKEMWTNTVCFTAVELETNVPSYDFFFNTPTYEYCSSMEEQLKKHLAIVREKTNPTT